ncbi:MAG TPA: ABC transporter permease subunit [Blastocatellia bacterium]|nr:ABC transporter permease subunit [Blastocatellia bacterium]
MKLAAIATNTFRETVRDKVLYNLVLFAVLLVGASLLIGQLSISQDQKIIMDMGLSSMLLFGTLIAIFIGIGLVYKELDKRTVYSLLTKPINRYEFILGKYCGLGLTLLVNSIVMAVSIALALLYLQRGFDRLQWALVPTAYLIFLELAVITAIALLFSSFSSPALSATLTFMVFLVGNFSGDFRTYAAASNSAVTKSVLYVLYYLLPNLSNFNFITVAAHGQVVPLKLVISSTIYAIIYCAVLLCAAIMIFERRDFK